VKGGFVITWNIIYEGKLKDNIIHFGEMFEPDILAAAVEKSKEGDLSLCLGSKLVVTPACDMPFYTKKSTKGKRDVQGIKKVAICNLQQTPKVPPISILLSIHTCLNPLITKDKHADLVIHHYY